MGALELIYFGVIRFILPVISLLILFISAKTVLHGLKRKTLAKFAVESYADVVEVKSSESIIGSGIMCDVRIKRGGINRQHALLSLTDYGFKITPMAEDCKLYVNDYLVEDEAYLQSGDKLKIGNTVLQIAINPAINPKAKAKSDKKECIYTRGQCIENYKKCEDYIGNNMATCEAIIQFNGKKCVFDSTGCKSYNKICSEATSVEECLLIAKTGVTDPERRVCDYETSAATFTCFENYKYCSDYRTIGSSTTITAECERIKPYDSSGNNLDITSVCEYKTENNVGCQRKLADCSKAITATECESISAKLESTNFYCAFLGGQCKKYYKTCELFDEDTDHSSVSLTTCEDNIPKEYNTKYCETEGGSCVSKTKTCSTFLKNYEGTSLNTLCTEIGPFCSYSSPYCSKRNINTCSEITSTLITGLTEEICNAFQIGGNKICSLKADKSGCEEKEKPVIPVVQEPTLAPKTQTPEAIETATPEEISSTTAETETPQEQGSTSSSSGLKLFRIQIIMVVLSLLI
jgi:hypothetical protein